MIILFGDETASGVVDRPGKVLVFRHTTCQLQAVLEHLGEECVDRYGVRVTRESVTQTLSEIKRKYYTPDIIWNLNAIQRRAIPLLFHLCVRAVSAQISHELDEPVATVRESVERVKVPSLGPVQRESYIRFEGMGPPFPPVDPMYHESIRAYFLQGKPLPTIPFPLQEYLGYDGYVPGTLESWMTEKRALCHRYFRALMEGTTFLQCANRFLQDLESRRLLEHPDGTTVVLFTGEDDETRLPRLECEYTYPELANLPLNVLGRPFPVPKCPLAPEQLWDDQYNYVDEIYPGLTVPIPRE